MQEREVSVGQTTYNLPEPFFTIATQNPIEQEGTYPLPEAQLDRFMFNIKVDYPSAYGRRADLWQPRRVRRNQKSGRSLSGRAILNSAEVGRFGGGQRIYHQVCGRQWFARRGPPIPRRRSSSANWSTGAPGPRAGQFLIHGGKALAAMDGRFTVAIEDVQKIAVPGFAPSR